MGAWWAADGAYVEEMLMLAQSPVAEHAQERGCAREGTEGAFQGLIKMKSVILWCRRL
jgi:hypothetical protein